MPDDAVVIPFGYVTHGELDPLAISPELVLVDPELARVARVELCERAEQLASPLPAATTASLEEHAEPAAAATPSATLAAAEFSRLRLELASARRELAEARLRLIEEPRMRREQRGEIIAARASAALGVFFTAVLFGSLLMNLGFIGFLVAPSGDQPTLATSAAVALLPPHLTPARTALEAPIVRPSSSSYPRGRRRASVKFKSREARAKAKAEQNIAALLLKTPKSRLPSVLITPDTGLLKNNVEIVCNRPSGVRGSSFLCVVHPQRAAPGTGLYISYRVTRHGRPKEKWLGFRKR